MPTDRLVERIQELQVHGSGFVRAFHQAWLEERLAKWPTNWGNELQFLIFGDFLPPEKALGFDCLRIKVDPEPQENTVIASASCVLLARIQVDERTVPGLVDAIRRINVLLGAWTIIGWGNSPIRWWSWVVHGPGGGAMLGDFHEHESINRAIEWIVSLPEAVRKRICAALYWIREPRSLLREFHREDLLRVYLAYWNAFECLVDGVSVLKPQRSPPRSEKQDAVNAFIGARSGQLTPGDVQKCYREIVNPGFVGKASHALRVCFEKGADEYIDECFRTPKKSESLYAIRNAISHGRVDGENPDELARIASRLSRLWLIVWRMFARLVPFAAPRDSAASDDRKH